MAKQFILKTDWPLAQTDKGTLRGYFYDGVFRFRRRGGGQQRRGQQQSPKPPLHLHSPMRRRATLPARIPPVSVRSNPSHAARSGG